MGELVQFVPGLKTAGRVRLDAETIGKPGPVMNDSERLFAHFAADTAPAEWNPCPLEDK